MTDPYKRLGSGPKGSPLSYDLLKQHEFFKGLDFRTLHKNKPPVDPALVMKLQSEKKKPQPRTGGNDSPREGTAETLEEELADTSAQAVWQAPPGKKQEDAVVKEGVINKKCGWIFYKKRKLVLTTRPRLSYFDPSNNEYKVLLILSTLRAIYS